MSDLFDKIDKAAALFAEEHYFAPTDYEYMLTENAFRKAASIVIDAHYNEAREHLGMALKTVLETTDKKKKSNE